jgi:hypothetical protein
MTSMDSMDETNVVSPAWKNKVDDLATRGFTLGALLRFYLAHILQGDYMPHFDPAKSTTKDVVRQVIIPASRNTPTGPCALAAVIMNGKTVRPKVMVTHHWDNIFTHTLAVIIADAIEVFTFGDIVEDLTSAAGVAKLIQRFETKNVLSKTYWFCAASVNQHCAICSGFGPGGPESDSVSETVYPLCGCGLEKHFSGDACEMNKFDDMMKALRAFHATQDAQLEQVVAVDVNFTIFTRAWCVAELVEANASGMPQRLKLFEKRILKKDRRLLETLDVRKCQASRPEDVEGLMLKIDDIDGFNRKLRKLLCDRSNGLFAKWKHETSSVFSFEAACDCLSDVVRFLV